MASPCAEIQHSQGFGRNHKIQTLGLNSSAPVAALAAGDLRLRKGVGLFGDKGLKSKEHLPSPQAAREPSIQSLARTPKDSPLKLYPNDIFGGWLLFCENPAET